MGVAMRTRKVVFYSGIVLLLVALALTMGAGPSLADDELLNDTTGIKDYCGYYCWDSVQAPCVTIIWSLNPATLTFTDSEGGFGTFVVTSPTITMNYTMGGLATYVGKYNKPAMAYSGTMTTPGNMYGRWTMIRSLYGCDLPPTVERQFSATGR